MKHTLKLILSNQEVMNYIENNTNQSHDDYMRYYEDGDHYKNHPFFSKYPNALRIQLYYDEFVGNNPLGNKVKEYKIGAFYYRIVNLPLYLYNFSGNINVLALCNDIIVRKYTLNDIIAPFVAEMIEFERDSGKVLIINNKEYVVRATLASVTGDTAALNPLLGFLGPAATHFCRICMIFRNELHRCYFCAEKRTPEMLEQQLQEISKNASASTTSGVKEHCDLNDLKYFNSCSNKVFDVLHDLFEGWIPYVIKLVIAHFVLKKKYIDVETINTRLKLFQYGSPEKSVKPSATFELTSLKNVLTDHTLKQKGVQTWCLLRVLPFILFDKVPSEDIYLQYLLELNKIVEIIMAPKISRSTLPYLKALLTTHYNQFNILFPTAKKINKLDHIMHIPECIEEFGPMCNYGCFIYEDKHQIFQKYTKICNNFINISKTMMHQSQIQQCAIWGTRKTFVREKLSNFSTTTFSVNELSMSEMFITAGFQINDQVGQTDKVNVYSVKYKLGLFVAIELHKESAKPIFGEIENIFIKGDEVFLYCKKWHTVYLEERLNAYNVEPTSEYCLKNVNDLCDHKPFSLWNTFDDGSLNYISLRYILY